MPLSGWNLSRGTTLRRGPTVATLIRRTSLRVVLPLRRSSRQPSEIPTRNALQSSSCTTSARRDQHLTTPPSSTDQLATELGGWTSKVTQISSRLSLDDGTEMVAFYH